MPPSFRVAYSEALRAALKALLAEVAGQDAQRGKQAREAAEAINARLHQAPRDFGEPSFFLRQLDLEVRHAVIAPLSVTFDVH